MTGKTPDHIAIDIASWLTAAKHLSAAAQAVAMAVTIRTAQRGLEAVPEPDIYEMQEYAQVAGLDNIDDLWPAVREQLVSRDGDYNIPWLRALPGATKRKPAAWRQWLTKEPLVNDPLFSRLWADYHEMRQTTRKGAWTDATCKRWLTKEVERYGSDVICRCLEMSTQQQWQGLFPEKVVREAHIRGTKQGASNNRGRVALSDWLDRRRKRLAQDGY